MTNYKKKCNICDISVDGYEGLLGHGVEHHPNYFVLGTKESRRYNLAEKKYWCPLDNNWYASRKYLARAIKKAGISNEEYYLKYGKEYMPEEWTANNFDEKYGDASGHSKCLQCSADTTFEEGKWHYARFCSFSCSTTWHAKNTDRVERAQETQRQRIAENPDHNLRPTQTRYWVLKGHTEQEAIELVSNRQKEGTLERMIEKYGEEEGSERYNIGLKNRKEAISKSDMHKGSSNVANTFFSELQEKSGLELSYGDNEMCVYCPKAMKNIWVDCYHKPSKKIIEFYGEYWHASPHKYVSESVVMGSKTAADIWAKDAIREQHLRDSGYKLLVIWEHEYRENPDLVFGKCLGFMLS